MITGNICPLAGFDFNHLSLLFVWYDMKKSLAQVSAGGISS